MKNRSRHDPRAALGEGLHEERDQRFRGLRAARIRAPKTPRRADQLDLSLHRYTRFRELATFSPRTASILLVSNGDAA